MKILRVLCGVITFIMFVVFLVGACCLDTETTNAPMYMVLISLPWLAVWGWFQSARIEER